MSIKSRIRKTIRRFGYELTPVQAALPREVRRDYDPILEEIGEYSFKFLDVKTFLPMTIQRAHTLGLHNAPAMDVLDIGTGVGYFPVVCKYYGHRAVAIDRDGNQVFMDATRWLGVDRRSWEVHRFEPLPDLGQRFDLITAFMVNFDRVEVESDFVPWAAPEWAYFLSDLARNHLKPHGSIAMVLNDHTRRCHDVLRYFAIKGARVEDNWVRFDAVTSLRVQSPQEAAEGARLI